MGNTLKRHYETYNLEYELAHDDVDGECCFLCHRSLFLSFSMLLFTVCMHTKLNVLLNNLSLHDITVVQLVIGWTAEYVASGLTLAVIGGKGLVLLRYGCLIWVLTQNLGECCGNLHGPLVRFLLIQWCHELQIYLSFWFPSIWLSLFDPFACRYRQHE